MDVSKLCSLTLVFVMMGQLQAPYTPQYRGHPFSPHYFKKELCPERTYKCCHEEWCIRLDQICDKKRDCLEGDDEENCQYCCPDKWVSFKGSCYYFGTTEYDQAGAGNACFLMDSSLVTIETSEENTFLQEFVSGHDFAGWWIGMERDDDGVLRWVTTGLEPDFTDWVTSPGNDDCVGFNSGMGDKWTTGNCGNHAPPICERQP